MPMMSFWWWCCSDVSVVNFEHVIAGWEAYEYTLALIPGNSVFFKL